MQLLLDLLLLSIAIFLVAKLIPAIHIKNFPTAIIVALVYSLINVALGWLLNLLTLPLTFLTFGLFKFVVNAFLLWLTDKIVSDFRIKNFGWTLIAAILISLTDMLIKTAVHRIF